MHISRCVCVYVYIYMYNTSKNFLKIIIALEREKKSTNTSSVIELNLFIGIYQFTSQRLDSTLGLKSDAKCTFTEPGEYTCTIYKILQRTTYLCVAK